MSSRVCVSVCVCVCVRERERERECLSVAPCTLLFHCSQAGTESGTGAGSIEYGILEKLSSQGMCMGMRHTEWNLV